MDAKTLADIAVQQEAYYASVDSVKAAILLAEAALADEPAPEPPIMGKYQQVRYQDATADATGYRTWQDEYDGPQGKGYIVWEERTVAGVTQRCATGVGPEAERFTRDWFAVADSM